MSILARFQFFLHLIKYGTVFGKNIVTYWHYLYGQFVCSPLHMTTMTTAYKNYSKFCTRKWEKQHCMYCDYNVISVIYIYSNVALLRERNHQRITYKVLDNKARLDPSPYKKPWFKCQFGSLFTIDRLNLTLKNVTLHDVFCWRRFLWNSECFQKISFCFDNCSSKEFITLSLFCKTFCKSLICGSLIIHNACGVPV